LNEIEFFESQTVNHTAGVWKNALFPHPLSSHALPYFPGGRKKKSRLGIEFLKTYTYTVTAAPLPISCRI